MTGKGRIFGKNGTPGFGGLWPRGPGVFMLRMRHAVEGIFFASERGSGGRGESSLGASAEAKVFVIRERKAFSCPLQGSCFLHKFLLVARGRRFPKGERKALWSPPQRRNPLGYGERKVGPFPVLCKKSVSCGRFRPPAGGRGTFHHWKVPKGCRGRPKGACGVAAPGPPVAKQQCTASLAGARPAGLTAYLGGPLSPSAQSIPPPVRWRRLILGVMARGRCHKDTLLWVSCGEKRVTVAAPAVARPGEVPLLAQGGRGTSLGDEGRRREYGRKRGMSLPPDWRGYASKGESLCRNKGPFSLFAFQANGTML